MAQFVTHIQPTLVESSHHHVPHVHHHKEHHKEHHKDHHHHGKEHGKDHGKDKEHHLSKSPHKSEHHSHEYYLSSHHREFPVLPQVPGDHHHEDHHHHINGGNKRDSEYYEHSNSSGSSKRDSGHYLDSHGISHEFELHFIDSQGIHRDFHGHGIDEDHHIMEKDKHHKRSDKSPYREEGSRPTPPQFINIQPVHLENKLQSDGNTSFLRAARNGQLDKVLEHLKSNIDINTSNSNGLNALHLASKDGHVTIVEELLKRGAVVDAATKKGNTALHIASLAGQEEVVKLLVQHGASVNVQSQNGFTPLYMAAQENHDNVVKYLLANGANQSLSTEDGFTPLAVAMQQGHDKVVTVLLENDTRGKIRLPALHIAAKKDDVKAAKLLLENEHNPDVTSKSGFTPLHIASHYGNQQIANLLIQKGADVNYAAKHNITPLHVAAKWGKSNMVALLLEHAATIDAKTRDGLTPLHCAARSGHEQVVDMLLERGAPISSKTKNGLAPLHMSAQGDHVDAARILLYHRAPVDEVTVDYLTALHVAAHCGHVRVAKLLLDRQADANARALNGFTPLHIACKKNRIKVVELLLKHGASIGATTESGLTPLHVASFMGCMNIVIYLLQHDANPDVPTVRGETPLHLAARANQTDIIRILLRNGSQVDARAREQQTPLHIASRLGNVDIVMLLLQHGAKVDNTTKDMYTSLHIAAKEGQDEVAGVLLENGASLDATTKKGFSPLHLAAKYGHLKVAKLLLQKEAPVDAQGKNGVTPLHVASHYDHQNVALLLLDKGASPHAAAKNGHTPLHIAARKNQMDIANTLLEYGAKPNAESKAGFTPLHLSAQEGHADMSALLLEHKGDANYEAKNGLTPLHLCAQEDRVPVAEVLVKNGANVNCATKGGYTPLHIASHYGQVNMVKFLLKNGADIESKTSLNYTPLHQAAQQGHATIVNILLEHNADPNAVTTNGQTPLNIAQKLGYITVIETLKVVTTVTNITTTTTINIEEKYKVQAPELMHETFMSDSEEEGGEDTVLGDHTYRYLTADEMKSLGDDSLPIDVTRDERIDSNRMVSSSDSMPPLIIEDTVSPEHITQNYVEYLKKYAPDNVDINKLPINIGFLVSFLVDARGGAMRGCRHSGVRVIVPPRCAPSPTRITCRYVRPQRTPHPPPLMEGEALASRVLELGPVGARFLGPVIIEVPHFAALRGKEREIVILRSDNGESWKEHSVDASEEILNQVLHDSFEADDLSQLEDVSSGRITRIVTQDFPQYFAVVSRVRQEVHAIGPEGGMVSSTVVPQVQAVFPEGALTKKIKVGLQAQPIDPELTAKLLGHGVAVSPVVTVEPRRRKFHKAITLSMPAPRAHSQGMINQYSGSAPTLRLLCSITGGTTRAQWEDVTGSTPLTFVNDCVSFTTTVSARFWLMDCRNIGDATKMATELYKEAIHVPFMAKFVVFAKRVDPLEARLRVFCMTDDKEDKTLEHQEHFTEVAKSRDVEVLEGKQQFVEFAGNLVPITKSGEQLSFSFRAFKENRLPFSVRVKDQHAEAVSRCLFMKEPKVPKGEPPQQPICILNIVLPEDIVTDTISLTDSDSVKHYRFLSENFDYYRPDPRLADMSNLLGEDWVSLANQLGLTTSEINVIKSEYPDSVAKQAQSMLRMWLSQTGNKAQTNTLENALKRIGREDIIPQCLNVDQGGQTITRIKQEEIGKYRLKKDVDSIEKEKGAVKEDVAPRAVLDIQEVNRFGIKDKYSAEEKVFVKSDEDEEEEQFDKPVAERREKIVKRLSAERTIPASSQRREIVQEITTIKEQNLVEDKIAEVLGREKTTDDITTKTITKTIVTPEIKTVSKTVGIKTTPPSESTVSEPTLSPEQTQVGKATVVTDTRTIQLEEPHKLSEDAELLEKVTQSFEKKKPIPKLIADEDPKSPKFSKTPPPSPADFITREQVASVQEWETTRQPLNLEPTAPPIAKDAAQQGIPTITRTEDRPFVNKKSLYDLTNALIQSESRAEPYHTHTEKYYKHDLEKPLADDDSTPKDDKKRKRGIFGTLKNFVSKSIDSDSDSEKSSPKKDKKKKDKKKTSVDVPPVPPPRKPKLPTPPIDSKYDDIPYFETTPTETPEHAIRVTKSYKPSSPTPVTDSDDLLTEVPVNITHKAKEIVHAVLTDGEQKARDRRSKSPKKQKTVILEEKVIKTFSPLTVEGEEFTITIDPTKKDSPKKTREIFTLNIDETDAQIEKEILEKSPILPEDSLIKPFVHIQEEPSIPIRSHVYEDILEPQLCLYPVRRFDSAEIKKLTNDLIQNEMCFTGWADDKHNIFKPLSIPPEEIEDKEINSKITDSQKLKRKHNAKLFGIFGKISKDDSDDDSSRKEVIEKQDKETSKEILVTPETVQEDSSKSTKVKRTKSKSKDDKKFLGLFKISKADEKKTAFSDTVIKDMIESTAFLKEEVDKYHDVRPVENINRQNGTILTEPVFKQEHIIEKKDSIKKSKPKIILTANATEDIQDETNDMKQKRGSSPSKIITTIEESKKTIKRTEIKIEPVVPDTISKVPTEKLENKDEQQTKFKETTNKTVEYLADSNEFLINKKEEIKNTYDVTGLVAHEKPIVEENIEITETVKEPKKADESSKKSKTKGEKGGFFGKFKKKETSVDRDNTNETVTLSASVVKDMSDSDTFLKDEIEKYHDVRPLVTTRQSEFDDPKPNIIPRKSKSKQGKIDAILDINKKEDESKPSPATIRIETSDAGRSKLIAIEAEPIKYNTTKIVELTEEKSPKKSKDKDVGNIFGIFKKKTGSLERGTKIETVTEKEKPALSSIVIKNMDDTKSFLKDEIDRYHDVRPIIQQPIIEEHVKVDVRTKALSKDQGAEKSHKTSKDNSGKDTGNIFGVFKKKSGSSERGVIVETVEEKPALSTNVVKDMKDTDTFLSNEINIYNDVRPLVQKPIQEEYIKIDVKAAPATEQPAEKVEKKLKEKSEKESIFTKIKKKAGTLERNVIAETVKTKPELSTTVIKDINDTDTFLKEEINIYHDVRPVVKKPVQEEHTKVDVRAVPVIEETAEKEAKKSRKQPEKDGVSFFGIFKKKTGSLERGVTVGTISSQSEPALSVTVIKDINDTDTFLKEEIDRYHDVRPIVRPQVVEERVIVGDSGNVKIKEKTPEKSEDKREKEGKGVFGIFGKKEKPVKSDIKKETAVSQEKPALSATVIEDMNKTDTFLKDEIDKYHDVRPIVTQKVLEEEIIVHDGKSVATTEQTLEKSPEKSKEKREKEGKGVFGIFGKKEKPVKSDIKKETAVSQEKPALSATVIEDMNKTDTFLKDEIDKYHDVRPIVTQKVLEEEIIVHDGKSVATTEQTLEKSPEKSKDKREKEGKGVFAIFGKKEKPVKSDIKKETAVSQEKPALSASVIEDMNKTDTFLKDEIDKYHDVRPIVTQKVLEEEIIVHDGKSVATTEQTLEKSPEKSKEKREKEGKGVFAIFGKKEKPVKSDIKKETAVSQEKPALSATVIEDMNKTDTFLKDEIDKYHDVRPIVTQKVLEEEIIVHDGKSVATTEQTPEKSPEKSKEKREKEGKGVFAIFGKKEKPVKSDIKKETAVSQEKPALSASVIEDMNKTDTFLKDEIDKYHDVRPIVTQKVLEEEIIVHDGKSVATTEQTPEKSPEKSKEKREKEGKGVFGIFGKKEKPVKSDIKKETAVSQEKPALSATVIEDMNKTDTFLKDEIDKYHDVRPIVTQKVLEEEIIVHDGKSVATTEQTPEKSPEKSKEKREKEGKGVFAIFGKKEKPVKSDIKKETAVSQEKPALSASVIEDMNKTDTFLKDEIDKYHDVRPIVTQKVLEEEIIVHDGKSVATTEQTLEKSPEKSKEKREKEGKGVFAIFGKKEKPVKSDIKKETAVSQEKPALSATVIEDMNKTDTFLKDEIDKYHDVRPIVTQKVLEEEIIVHDGKSVATTEQTLEKSPGKSKDKREKEGKGVFAIFGKKEKPVKSDIKKETAVSQEKPALSATVIEDMNKTDTFLKDEIDKYHDVRPIVTQKVLEEEIIVHDGKSVATTEQTLEKSPEKSKEKREKEGKGVFAIFGKKEKPVKSDIKKETAVSQEKPALSATVIEDMNKTDTFLKDETDKYHDVRPIVTQKVLEEEIIVHDGKSVATTEQTLEKSPEKSKEKREKEGKGVFAIFGKKEKPVKSDIKKETAVSQEKPALSASVIEDMNKTDTFLKDETDKYHDVRPIVTQKVLEEEIIVHDGKSVATTEQSPEKSPEKSKEKREKEGKGVFAIFGKKEKPVKSDIKKETAVSQEKPALSASVIEDMNKTDTFLKDEIDKYHDVRPIVTQKVLEEEIIVHDGKSVATTEQTLEMSPEKSKEKREKEGKGVFAIFGKKEKPVKSDIKKETAVSQEKPALSASVIEDMNKTDTFLKDEIDKYHDVRPIVTQKVLEEEIIVHDGKSVATTEQTPEKSPEKSKEKREKEGKGVFAIFGKKEKPVKSDIKKETVVSQEKPALSATVIEDMNKTDTFLKDEIDKYHDVRPIVTQKVLEEEIIVHDGKSVATTEQTPEKSPEKSKEKREKEGKGVFGIFGKKEKPVKSDIKKETAVSQEKPALSATVIEDMNKTDTFLKDEIDKYDDGKISYSIQTTEIIKAEKDCETAVADQPIEQSTQFDKSEDVAENGSDKYYKIRHILEKAENQTVEPDFVKHVTLEPERKLVTIEREITIEVFDLEGKPESTAILKQQLPGSDSFLNTEIDKYDDVRPIVQKSHVEASSKESKATADKVGFGFFGLFKKKGSEEKSEVTKNIQDNESLIVETVKQEVKEEPKLEVATMEIQGDVSKTKEIVDGNKTGLFGIFKKKPKEETTKVKTEVFSNEVLENMRVSDSFLKYEVDKYHDVRPVTEIAESAEPVIRDTISVTVEQKEIPNNDAEIKRIPEEREKVVSSTITECETDRSGSPELKLTENTVMDSETSSNVPKKHKKDSGLFGIFKKKPQDHRAVTSPLPLSEIVIKHMQDSDRFLKDEIEKYQDVRPIIKETITGVSSVEQPVTMKETETQYPGGQKGTENQEEKSGLFGIFKKKSGSLERDVKGSSKDKEAEITNLQKDKRPEKRSPIFGIKKPKIVLSEDTMKNMSITDSFLQTEVENYHDAKPIIVKTESEVVGNGEKITKKSKDQSNETGRVGIFGIFKKKTESLERDNKVITQGSSPEIEHPEKPPRQLATKDRGTEKAEFPSQPDIDIEKKPKLSTTTQKEFDQVNTFLQTEIDKYHDVKPIILKEIEEPSITAVVTSPPSKEKDTKMKDGKGLFGIFKKKSESVEREIKQEDSKEKSESIGTKSVVENEKLPLSEKTKQEITDSNKFLQTEIDKYHDVRTIVETKKMKSLDESLPKELSDQQTETPVKKQKDMRKGGLFGIFKKKTRSLERDVKGINKDIADQQTKSDATSVFYDITDKQEPTKTAIEVVDSDTFLKTEVDKYHDAKPVPHKDISLSVEIPTQSLTTTTDKIECDATTKKLFDQLKDESPKRTITTTVTKQEIPHGERTTIITNDLVTGTIQLPTDTLSDIEKLEEEINTKLELLKKEADATYDEVKKETVIEKAGFPSQPDIDIEKKPKLSTTTQKEFEHVNTFLQTEIDKYHDVKPIILKEIEEPSTAAVVTSPPSKEKDTKMKDGKGLFGIFKKKSESVERDIKQEDSKEKSESIGTKSVVENEKLPPSEKTEQGITDNFLQTREKVPDEQKASKQKDKKDKKSGLFGIFKKTDSEVQTPLKDSTEVSVEESESVDTFSTSEIDRYHQIRPIGEKPEETKVKFKEPLITEIPPPKVAKTSEPKLIKTSHITHEIYTTETPHNKLEDVEKLKSEVESCLPLGANIVQIPVDNKSFEETIPKENLTYRESITAAMKDTDNFLKQEVAKFHDVRPQFTSTSKQKLPKDSVTKEIKGLFGIFTKKESEEREDESKAEKSEQGKHRTEDIKSINDSDKFLRKEIEKYHDVRTQERVPSAPEEKEIDTTYKSDVKASPSKITKTEPGGTKQIVITEKHFVKEGGYLSEVFVEEKTEKRSYSHVEADDINKNLNQTSNFLNTELDKYEDNSSGKREKSKKKPDADVQPQFSREVIANMIASSDFLREEVANYHDVKQNYKQEEPPVKEKTKLFGGLFSKKKSSEKDSEPKSGEEEQSKIKSKKKTKKGKDETAKPESKDFSKIETDRYQEGKKSKEESTSFFGLFSKKTKPQEQDKNVDEQLTQQLSSEVIQHMKDSSNFLNTEIELYQDVRPDFVDNFQPVTLSPINIPDTSFVLKQEASQNDAPLISGLHTRQEGYQKIAESFTTPTVEIIKEESPKRTVTTYITNEAIPRGERTTKVKTEVITGSIQLSPEILDDIEKLEKEINTKLNELRQQTDPTEDIIEQPSKLSEKSTEMTPQSLQKQKVVSDAQVKKSEIPDSPLPGKITELSFDQPPKTEQKLNERILKQMQDSHSFLLTELENYDNGKPVMVTDLDEDPKVKSSGLFGIFSKKSESPKITKRRLKKGKEKPIDESDKVGILDKIGRKLTGGKYDVEEASKSMSDNATSEILRKTDDTTDSTSASVSKHIDYVKESSRREHESIITKIIEEGAAQTDKVRESAKDNVKRAEQSITDTSSTFKEAIKEKSVIEDAAATVQQTEDKTRDATKEGKVTADKAGKKATGFFNKISGKSEESDTKKDKKSKKSSGILSKLGGKGKVSFEYPEATIIDEKIISTDTDSNITDDITKTTHSTQEIVKSETFTEDLLKSFDEKLEHVKEERDLKESAAGGIKEFETRTENIKKGVSEMTRKQDEKGKVITIPEKNVDSFEKKIDEKFSETMKLSKELIKRHDETAKKPTSPSQNLLESQRKRIETDVSLLEDAINKKSKEIKEQLSDEIIYVQKAIKIEKSKLGEMGKDVGKKIGKNVEIGIASTVQNVENAAKISKSPEQSSSKEIVEQIDDSVNVIHKKLEKLPTTKTDIEEIIKAADRNVETKTTSTVEREAAKLIESTKADIEGASDVTSFFDKLEEKMAEKRKKKAVDIDESIDNKISDDFNTKVQSATNVTITSVKEDPSKKLTERSEKFGSADKYNIGYFQQIPPLKSDIRQETMTFLESECQRTDDPGMSRAVSDYGSQIKTGVKDRTRNISEADIDLSNLSQEHEGATISYIMTPSFKERIVSTRITQIGKPQVIEITYDSSLDSSSDNSYIVTEPDDELPTKTPLFQMESGSFSRSGLATSSNISETSSESKIILSDSTKPIDIVLKQEEERLKEHKKESQAEVDIIEKKLRDLDKALDSLEKVEIEIDDKIDKKTEKKLRRVERKFERMASEALDTDTKEGKKVQLTSPEIEIKRESDYQTLISQLSIEDLSDFQKEYSHLWDEHTFSKSSDRESKTPDSQADAQELPQGEIVYMGPVNLNKDHTINKAGVEVDVIPIMRSPCPSPKPRKKNPTTRSKSAMSYYRNERLKNDESGSLPNLKSSSLKSSLVDLVIQMDPKKFTSTQSLISGESGIRSKESTESLPKGTIMKAVVNWLEKSSPFSSIENLDRSIPDLMETSCSLIDDELESTDERSVSKSDCIIPDINIFCEDDLDQGADGTATSPSTKDTAAPSTSRPQVTRRRPLRYEISVEDQTEVDPREHDWRFNLPKHAEGEEGAEKEETEHERRVADQHQLSEEMKQLLKELEKETKQ
ncbi:uncharacterized protein LOC130897163 isoform X11 [Diorhabda carinulata]|uniref:uncharacterized protein LOC130897163 isoform X11 n=1 Tax=Diorhabda carinulata TaxID=1163345 RepID=UPI0025A054ED|nr:uncharacterized protein LOC130897163 isoform X11 [Diorhabda carinulata]